MIRLGDVVTLAYTKLRTRKIRLIVTVMISGLLFSLLVVASLITRGVFASVESFNQEGFASRYIVKAYSQPDMNFYDNPTIIARAKELQQDIISRKKAFARSLSTPYDPTQEKPVVDEVNDNNGIKRQVLSFDHPIATQAINEYFAKNPPSSSRDLQKLTKPYKAVNIYEDVTLGSIDGGGQFVVIENGQERFQDDNAQVQQSAFSTMTQGQWALTDSALLRPFLLSGQNLQVGANNSLPIIIPYDAAEKLTNMKPLPGSANAEQKLQQIKSVREKVAGLTFSACYRNGASAELINQAIRAQQEIEQRKHDKDFHKPDLQYGLPAQACGTIPIIRDVRTSGQKRDDAKREAFAAEFGKEAPKAELVSFRVVGVSPAPQTEKSSSVSQIAGSILSSSLGIGWYSPRDIAKQSTVIDALFYPENPAPFSRTPSFYAEFSSAENARQFMEERNCQPDFSNTANPTESCIADGKPFMLTAYGSNSLALESAKRNFGNIFLVSMISITILAAVIMMGTVGRMITDSRRETAVFRAMGAKRMDIVQIYMLYAIFIALCVAVFAVIIGYISAVIVDMKYSHEVTTQALIAYGTQNLDKTFYLYDLQVIDMGGIVGAAIAAGFLSTLLPLARNVRRNPIRDMRDDT